MKPYAVEELLEENQEYELAVSYHGKRYHAFIVGDSGQEQITLAYEGRSLVEAIEGLHDALESRGLQNIRVD